MADAHDEVFSGDLPTTSTRFADERRPTVSHEVIASYVANAARTVPGILHLHPSHWQELSSRVRETHSGGVVLKESESGMVDVEIHVRVAWGSIIPNLARQVEESVRSGVKALLGLDLGAVTLFVDEIAEPTEDDSSREG